ncbi:hypothetical protein K438DRAFT_1513718, partial [Mycena galopus ATCC 62051]
VDRTCDTYLDELQESLGAICGAEASQATIWRTLRRCGYRMKKRVSQKTNTIQTPFGNGSEVWSRGCNSKQSSLYLSMRVLLIDGPHTEVMPGLSVVIVPSERLFLYSILPALSLDGIIAVDIVEGSLNTIRFARFIDGLLDQMSPFPLPNSVIIMDNCHIHKCPEVLDMITD